MHMQLVMENVTMWSNQFSICKPFWTIPRCWKQATLLQKKAQGAQASQWLRWGTHAVQLQCCHHLTWAWCSSRAAYNPTSQSAGCTPSFRPQGHRTAQTRWCHLQGKELDERKDELYCTEGHRGTASFIPHSNTVVWAAWPSSNRIPLNRHEVLCRVLTDSQHAVPLEEQVLKLGQRQVLDAVHAVDEVQGAVKEGKPGLRRK